MFDNTDTDSLDEERPFDALTNLAMQNLSDKCTNDVVPKKWLLDLDHELVAALMYINEQNMEVWKSAQNNNTLTVTPESIVHATKTVVAPQSQFLLSIDEITEERLLCYPRVELTTALFNRAPLFILEEETVMHICSLDNTTVERHIESCTVFGCGVLYSFSASARPVDR